MARTFGVCSNFHSKNLRQYKQAVTRVTYVSLLIISERQEKHTPSGTDVLQMKTLKSNIFHCFPLQFNSNLCSIATSVVTETDTECKGNS